MNILFNGTDDFVEVQIVFSKLRIKSFEYVLLYRNNKNVTQISVKNNAEEKLVSDFVLNNKALLC